MKSAQVLLAAMLVAGAATGGAYAADQAAKADATQMQPGEKAVLKDVGKLSTDGRDAFRDLHEARLAIFNADPADAKSLIDKAKTAIEKAKTDDASYMKAEAKFEPKLNPPAKAGGTKANATDDTSKEVAWLPIDGQLALGEDFVATPEKTEALGKANKSVQSGDQAAALQTLKLADIDVDFTMAVLPLDKTASDIETAAKLIDGGQYYEANAVLKQTEERIRFDSLDVDGVPTKTTAAAPAAAPASAAAKPAPAAAK